jgi:hypothetical protein
MGPEGGMPEAPLYYVIYPISSVFDSSALWSPIKMSLDSKTSSCLNIVHSCPMPFMATLFCSGQNLRQIVGGAMCFMFLLLSFIILSHANGLKIL